MNGTLLIRGGQRLAGSVTPIPNKNAFMAALPAALLTNETITYKNAPQTSDVQKHLSLLKKLGAQVDDTNYAELKINCSTVTSYEVDAEIGSQFRSSIMLAGPLLARFGKAVLPLPGGCVLGARSIAAHIDSFTKVGVEVEMSENKVTFTVPSKMPSKLSIWQNEASVTATENVALYLAGAQRDVTVINAACEPHVTQLLTMLSEMGALIDGVGSNKIRIKGQISLSGTSFVPEPDFVDVAGFIVAAALTKGHIIIKGANHFNIVGGLVETFKKFNLDIKEKGSDLIVDASKPLTINLENSGFPLAGKNLPKLKPAPWPGFPVDVIPVMAALACKLEGKLLLQNWMYETGLEFVRELNAIGANIFVADPQRVIIMGPVSFKGGEIMSPGVIQACKAIFLAALADNVETTLHGAAVLKRRYPNIVEVYRSLGADITEL